jgi:hypothetical protein
MIHTNANTLHPGIYSDEDLTCVIQDYGYIDGHCGVILPLILTCKKRKILKTPKRKSTMTEVVSIALGSDMQTHSTSGSKKAKNNKDTVPDCNVTITVNVLYLTEIA